MTIQVPEQLICFWLLLLLLPGCAPAQQIHAGTGASRLPTDRTPASFHAVGSEPGWFLSIEPEKQIEFIGDYGEIKVNMPAPKPVQDPGDGTTVYNALAGANQLKITIREEECWGGMNGFHYQNTVLVEFNGKRYEGCGQPPPLPQG